MAIGMYRGVNNVARKVKKMHRGVNNVARKVTKGYRGVNNIARKFFSSETYLYNAGDKCTSVTGGWTYVAYVSSDYSSSNASVTYNSNNMVLHAQLGSSKKGDCSIYTTKKIDLSKYKKLCAKVSATGNGVDMADVNFLVLNALPTASTKPTWHKGVNLRPYPSTSVVTMDISDINTTSSIGFWAYDLVSDSVTAKITIHQVWLEE